MSTHTRRRFIGVTAGICAGTLAFSAQNEGEDEVIATATQDTTPRVGIVLSNFTEGIEHDGTKLAGLASPQPVDASLSTEFIEAWVGKAIEMGSQRTGDLSKMVRPDDWVVIKTDISTCHGLEPAMGDGGEHQPYIPGSVTDLRVVRAVVNYLLKNGCGGRITIAEGSGQWRPIAKSKLPVDGWTSEWGGAFGGLSYKKIVDEFSKKYPRVRVEIADLNFADSLELPVPRWVPVRPNGPKAYTIAKVIQQCDKLISIAPLKTDERTGVSLTFGNYFGIAPGTKYGFPKTGLLKLDSPDGLVLDLFSYHPADYCILGGSFGVEGGRSDAVSVHNNLLVTGTKAASVDAVAATLMGFVPAELPHLVAAEKSDHGTIEVEWIWTRGNQVEQAVRPFRKPLTRMTASG